MSGSRRLEQELAAGAPYEPLPSLPEGDVESPELAGGEGYEIEAISNLDLFFTRIYRYWQEKGVVNILVARLLNLLALAFTIAFSSFLLLFVNWHALHSECIVQGTCDIMQAAIYKHPLQAKRSFLLVALVMAFLIIFSMYWVWTLVHLVQDVVDVFEIRHFVTNKLGISERQIQMMTWSEVVLRIALVQRSTRLCVVRDLSEHDIVGRIMRKENYLVGMLNKGVLALHVPMPGLRRRFMLTKTLEWNLYWCILDHMFDDHFHLRSDFLEDEAKLQRRFKRMAIANLLLSPFMLLFLLIYFFMRNAEKFYHHPGSLGSRRWSALAKWRLREFNELPHYVTHRLNASHKDACSYINQFPSPLMMHTAKFMAFISGSFVALLLLMTVLDEGLLERPLLGRHVVWWLATLGIVLTVSRSFVSDDPVAFDPERAMSKVVCHTHYLPRHWRGRAHTREVQEQFQALFQLKVLLFMEEVASLLLTPFVLYYSLPRSAGNILSFVKHFTTHVDGVGDICSLSAFDFNRHGNSKYGAPTHCSKAARSRQGKMEKSFLTFAATYPSWNPNTDGQAMLEALSQHSTRPLNEGSQFEPPPGSSSDTVSAGVLGRPLTTSVHAIGAAPFQQAPHGSLQLCPEPTRKDQAAPAPDLLGGDTPSPPSPPPPPQNGRYAAPHTLTPNYFPSPTRALQQHRKSYWGSPDSHHHHHHHPPPASSHHHPHAFASGLPRPVHASTVYPEGWTLDRGGGVAHAMSQLRCSIFGTDSELDSCSDSLLQNETEELSRRLRCGQTFLQNFYESRDFTVQHRHHQHLHSRSILATTHGGVVRGGGLLSP